MSEKRPIINIQFRYEGTHLVATCQGEWESQAVTKALTDMRDMARPLSHTRIFVGWRNVSGPIKYSPRFTTGEVVARILLFSFKVAGLDEKEVINKLAETTAVNRGVLFWCHTMSKSFFDGYLEVSLTMSEFVNPDSEAF